MQRGGDTHRGVEEATTLVIKWCSVMNQAPSDSEIAHWLLLIHILGFRALPRVIITSEGSLHHLLPHNGGPGSFVEKKGTSTVKFLIHTLSMVTEVKLETLLHSLIRGQTQNVAFCC